MPERTSSTQSLSRGSPSAANSVKGTTQKSHKTHAVGHHRHSHGKTPSYGKNMNTLSKLTAIHPADESSPSKNHTNTKSQTPASSPASQQTHRNTQHAGLPKTGSKASFKTNSSNVSLKHNGSSSKLGHSKKSQRHTRSPKGSVLNLPLKGKAQFSVGSDDQDEEWVEASRSQSPSTTRQSPNNSRSHQLEEPPSPDEPAGRTPTILPHSPPQSPLTNDSTLLASKFAHRPEPAGQFSHLPDAEVVTHRLLNRHKPHNVAPQMSTVSASITPSGSNGSPAFNHNHDPTLIGEPSMPADGISRFLNPTGSSSGSATPGSVSQLQSTLANIHRTLHHPQDAQPLSPSSISPPITGKLEGSNRAKSAGNLSQPRLSDGDDPSVSPPSPQVPNNTRVSPYKSARDPREAARTMTQLKLDLQRMSTNCEPAHAPAVQVPLAMIHGPHAVAGLGGATGEQSAERRVRQWEQAGLEFRNGRRFTNMVTLGVGRLEKRREKKKAPARGERGEAFKAGGDKNAAAARGTGARPGSRGRVRFEIGRREGEDEEDERGGLQGLLKRMWEGNSPEIGEG